ncbi:MAG: hypothetical protein WCL49_02560 [bacterium]
MSTATTTSAQVAEAVKRLAPDWPYDETRPGYDMDDRPDLPVFKGEERLNTALAVLQKEIGPVFEKADTEALSHQWLHRRLTMVAAVSGAFAVLFSITQLIFPSLGHWRWMSVAEVGVTGVALLVVIFGVRAAIQINWLLERFRAERLRQLKFTLLLHEDLWGDRVEVWQAHVRQSVRAIQQMDRKAMEVWVDQDRVHLSEKEKSGCVLESGLLRALTGFYIAKRLGYQMAYFERRSRQHGGKDRWLRLWPSRCFYGSVAAVALHYLTKLLPIRSEEVEWLSLAFIFLAFALPVAGTCVRTLRSALELGRSASLFHAKYSALQNLLARLQSELETDPVRSVEVMNSMAACEDFLEAEQREWLRLMREAEWFG